MESINRAIEGARDFQDFMARITTDENRFVQQLRADRGESVQANPLPLGMERQAGENRAAHRARLKAERRARKVPA